MIQISNSALKYAVDICEELYWYNVGIVVPVYKIRDTYSKLINYCKSELSKLHFYYDGFLLSFKTGSTIKCIPLSDDSKNERVNLLIVHSSLNLDDIKKYLNDAELPLLFIPSTHINDRSICGGKMRYIHYTDITRELLDMIQVGDLVKINDWENWMCVKAVSENYFVMTSSEEDGTYYSVCSKLPWNGVKHNAMTGGMFHCSTDDWVFGSPLGSKYEYLYEFENDKANAKYLESFEKGEAHLSERNGIPITDLYIALR